MKNLWQSLSPKVESIAVVTILLQLLMVIFVPRYTSFGNIQVLMRSIPTLGVVALGVCLLMTAQEFDLSVGSTFALAPLIAVILAKNGVNIWFAFLFSL